LENCEKLLEKIKYPRLWFAQQFHRTHRGLPLDFSDKPYFVDIYRDNSPRIVIEKSVKVGVTEFLIADGFCYADKGLNVFHVLPTEQIRNTFIHERIDKSVAYSEYYKRRFREGNIESDSVSLKHFGEGAIRYVGSSARSAFLEFVADIIVIDERNDCDEENLPLAFDRYKASQFKWSRMAGIPTIPEYGIDEEFLKSDQKHWHVRCPHCGRFQKLDFFENVVRQTGEMEYELLDGEWDPEGNRDIHVFCRYCMKPMDRLGPGEWAKENEKSNVSGYHLSKLYTTTTRVSELWDILQDGIPNPGKLQKFHNSDLGVPYSPRGEKMTAELLDRCRKDYFMPLTSPGPCSMGVDVGKLLHVRISESPERGLRKAVFIGTIKSFDELEKLMPRYGVRLCVIDARPDIHKVGEFQKKNSGRVLLCTYASEKERVYGIVLNRKKGEVTTNRTASLDSSHEAILDECLWLPKNAQFIDKNPKRKEPYGEFYRQMMASVRVYDEKKGYAIWTKGEDHYRHADNYDLIAAKLLGMGRSEAGKKRVEVKII